MDTLLLTQEAVRDDQRRSILVDVQKSVPAEIYRAILDELADSSCTFDYRLTTSPEGREQDDGAPWGKHFVHQTTNGGHSGDEFAGTVSIPLGDGRFFQFSYEM